jgi:mRNA interferase MazF
MALKFHPEPGTILVCDFTGMKAPEMVKTRPVVVVSPRLKHRDGLLTVVPLSTTPPPHICDYHCEITLAPPLPEPFDRATVWVKCDMIYNVAFWRLELIRTARDHTGKRKYLQRIVAAGDMAKIRACLLHGLGLGHLTKHL